MAEPESYSGIFATLDEATARAIELRAANFDTRVEQSLLWLDRFVVYAAPHEEAAE